MASRTCFIISSPSTATVEPFGSSSGGSGNLTTIAVVFSSAQVVPCFPLYLKSHQISASVERDFARPVAFSHQHRQTQEQLETDYKEWSQRDLSASVTFIGGPTRLFQRPTRRRAHLCVGLDRSHRRCSKELLAVVDAIAKAPNPGVNCLAAQAPVLSTGPKLAIGD